MIDVPDVERSEPKLGWRDEKRLTEQQQGKRAKVEGPCSQNRDRPGCDIFGAPL